MSEVILVPSDKLEKLLRQILQEELKLIPASTKESNGKDEILDFKQTLLFLRISKPTLFKRMADGTIPYKKIGRRLLFQKSEIMQALNNNSKQVKRKINKDEQ